MIKGMRMEGIKCLSRTRQKEDEPWFLCFVDKAVTINPSTAII